MKLTLRDDGTAVVIDPVTGPYHVTSREVDPCNKYDLAEILQYAKDNPEDVVEEPKPEPPPEMDELLAYLKSTDWYAVRFAETGKAIPEAITMSRNAVRERISELRAKE